MKQIFSKLRRIISKQPSLPYEWFTGDYSSWNQARANCRGYDAPEILEKVTSALLKVKRGEAIFERDSVIFEKAEYSFPLVALLLYVASAAGNKLDILDFGGSLGSTYFQNRGFLGRLEKLSWNIVEQPHFVARGNELFCDNILSFYLSIEECLKMRKPNLMLLSSVIPYLENPYETLREVVNQGFTFILIDRTPFFTENLRDRITIEHVPPEIYDADYPAWFFNRDRLVNFLSEKYQLLYEFDSWEKWTTSGDAAQSKCLLFERLQ